MSAKATYRRDGSNNRRFRAVIRYPDGHTRTVGKRRHFTAEDARKAAQDQLDRDKAFYNEED